MTYNKFNPLPDRPILGSSAANKTANKDIMSKIWTNGYTVIWLSRKFCRKRRNCSFSYNVFKSCLLLMRLNEYLCSKGLKEWREKEVTLIISIFSFSLNVFYPVKDRNHHFSKFHFSSAYTLNLVWSNFSFFFHAVKSYKTFYVTLTAQVITHITFGKVENASYQQFLIFPKCFEKSLLSEGCYILE